MKNIEQILQSPWIYVIAYSILIITSILVNRNKLTKDFISWIRPSFEGADGKASYRALSAFVLLLLICYKVIFDPSRESVDLSILYSLETTFLLLTSVISMQNVITMIKGYNSNSKEEEKQPLKEGDKVQVEIGKIE